MWGFTSSSSSTNPPVLAQSASSASSATTVSTHEPGNSLVYTYKVQIFPHRENAQVLGAIPGAPQPQRFHFEPIERDLMKGMVLKIGRKVDKKPPPAPIAQPDELEPTGISIDGELAASTNEVAVLPASYQSTSGFIDYQPTSSDPHTAGPAASSSTTPAIIPEKKEQPQVDFIAFKSKVVSRTHAELWVSEDGQVMFKDVGSSSGTWVNRHRLSPSGKESRPYAIKSGDVIQLGMDYQGRQEDMYKSVVMKIFVTIRSKDPPKPNPLRLKAALRALLSAMNPTSTTAASGTSCTDCCICLSPLSPLQTLFLAPCSHCFHFRCVMPLLGSSVMFQCPLCRQVANLEKGVGEDEESLFDGEGGGDVVGETSLEEWLGVLRVDNNSQGQLQGVESSGESGNEVEERDVVREVENALDGLDGLDESTKADVLERIRLVLEGKK
ncbi:hypothetical protein BCR33DRAFT_722696 [Rhizoclosmatium globosum]|uniref:SMAD/FHA domain-containing protein n=1 Tax=Rhizoclosmatium globosum TaxID=329046 RepID=A0A1Y2BIT0_9FUNG|nr:hypothetical protein BCR33DRAFT_722696 [Rhizoclosmatium globosum]|eukprot:ORY34467.1 hypothetical protein BCR33DRAFT_722696 [Rhizoclosmatium globosum]